ncbi:MAG: sensor histidine kinase [Spirochaetota bacterium]
MKSSGLFKANIHLNGSAQFLLESVISSIQCGAVAIFDTEKRYRLAGGRALHQHGFDPDQLLGKRPDELFENTLSQQLSTLYTAALLGRQKKTKFWYRNRAYALTAIPLREAERVIGGVAIANDVTAEELPLQLLVSEEKRSRFDIYEYKQLLEKVISITEARIVIIDSAHNVVLSNIEPKSSRYCYEYLWGMDEKCHGCIAAEFFSKNLAISREKKVYLSEEQVVMVRTIPILESGKVKYLVEHVTDISEKERLQNDLQNLVLHFEKEIAGRTENYKEMVRQLEKKAQEKEAAETRLNTILSQLEFANRELETFTYSVSHDLKAPVRNMKAFHEALCEEAGEALNENSKRYLARMNTSLVKMEKLIDGLLMLSRINTYQLNREKVDLSGLFGFECREMESADPTRDVDWKVQPGMRVDADKSLIEAVVHNLVSNAWKYTSKQKRSLIEIGSYRDRGTTVFYIKDNGAGFDMKAAENLFKPFQRLHSSTEFAGSGIGLSTVYRVINRHGGTVWAESEVGKGSTFCFTLEAESRSWAEGD